MAIQLNHTIVPAHNPHASAALLAEVLGCRAPTRYGPFHGVEVDNGVTLDFMRTEGDIAWQHYAFLVSEAEFNRISSSGSAPRAACLTGPIPATISPARSTAMTAGAVCTGTTRTAISWRSSRVLTAAVIEPAAALIGRRSSARRGRG